MPTLLALIHQFGLALVFANVLVEQLGAPVPALPTLVVSGALAAGDSRRAAALVAVAFIACMIGDLAWYVAGRRFGYRVLKTLCRISINPDSCVTQTESLYTRWGAASLVLAKFIPGFSTVAPPLAGALGVGVVRFVAFDGMGALLWIGVGAGVGIVFNRQVDSLLAALDAMGMTSLVLVGALLAAVIVFKWVERTRMLKQFRMTRITVEELRQMQDDGHDPIIVDVRSAAARTADPRQIPGALAIEPDRLDDRIAELPRDRELVVYCNCPNEVSAAKVANELKRRGYRHVRPLQGGLDAWDTMSGTRVA